MIKIDRFFDDGCEVTLKVLPIRPCNIVEKELGKDVARNSPDYYIAGDGNIYKVVNRVALTHTLTKLREMQKEAQETFSQKIHNLKESLDKFKRLQKLAKKEALK